MPLLFVCLVFSSIVVGGREFAHWSALAGEADVNRVKELMRELQDDICNQFVEIADGQRYFEEEWSYEKGR